MQTVLVIDDEAALRATLRTALEDAGYRVVEAGDGSEGLTQFAREKPDLVLMDIIMPNMEGIETILELRKQKVATPIIAMSGGGRLDATDVLEIAGKFGTEKTISKPFRMSEMVKAVRSLLPEQAN